MKLSTKLLLSFSSAVALIVVIACLSWNAANNLQRQKDVLTGAEDFISRVLAARSSVLGSIIGKDPQQMEVANDQLNTAMRHLRQLEQDLSLESTKEIIRSSIADIKLYEPKVTELANLFQTVSKIDAQITPIGGAAVSEIEQLKKKAEEQYHLSGNADLYIALTEINTQFIKVRLALMNYLFSGTGESREVAISEYATLKDVMDKHDKIKALDSIASNIETYLNLSKPLLDFNAKLTNVVSEADIIGDRIVEDSTSLSGIARGVFDETKASIVRQLIVSTIISLVLAVGLTIILNKNVMNQLGADPSDLSLLAERVTNGDYDINDGKDHHGVYNHIIIMVEKMKDALQFTNNVLASFPIPCAVFSAENKLKYANREMMNLLEIPKKMEDCLGETSGQFAFRQENYPTAALKALQTNQQGRVTFEYTTYKNNHIHVDSIAQPLHDRQGKVTDVISVWNNITEQTLANQKIEEAHENMQNIAKELEQVAAIASSASEQLSNQIELSEHGAQDQADRVASTATALEEMNATVLEIARNAGTTSDSAAAVRTEASAGSESMQECVKAMEDVRSESLKLQTEMSVLSDHAQAINQIMNVISDIADQTNLLALNAAIEAARAGDAGRGFAVVADEVRNLAEKTMASTTDVGNAIAAIQKSTDDNTRLVIGAVEKIEKVTEMVSHAGDALLGIVQLADTTADQVRAIATASEEQSATSEEITQSVESINSIAKENATNMQEARQAVSEVVSQSNVLSNLINKLQMN